MVALIYYFHLFREDSMRMKLPAAAFLGLASVMFAPVSAQAAEDELEAAFDTATWYFQCPTDRVPVPMHAESGE